jgi:hypothetical protein
MKDGVSPGEGLVERVGVPDVAADDANSRRAGNVLEKSR